MSICWSIFTASNCDDTTGDSTQYIIIETMLSMSASASDLLQCRFEVWYPKFAKLSIKSRLVGVTNEFINYLLEDGIYLDAHDDEDRLSEDSDLKDVSDSTTLPSSNRFVGIQQQLSSAINELNAPTFVKLNYTAPIDAAWVNGSLKCLNSNDIILLLKSSNRVAYDLEHAFDLCLSDSHIETRPEQSSIVVRKYVEINPALEFRVFVVHKRLRKICQRNCTTFYPFLISEMDNIKKDIYKFYMSNQIASKFPLSSFTMDVYVTEASHTVRIIDFNPLGEPTNALLFEWSTFASAIAEESLASSTPTASSGSDSNSNDPRSSPNAVAVTLNPDDALSLEDMEYDLEEIEFAVVESPAHALRSTIGDARAPVDVSRAPDFHQFMELCRSQRAAPGEEEEG